MEHNPTHTYPWRVFFVLLLAGSIGAAAVIPYALASSAATLRTVPIPLALIAILQIVQGVIFVAIAASLGLLISSRFGLGAPLLQAWLYKGRTHGSLRRLGKWTLSGVSVGVIVAVLERFVFLRVNPQLSSTDIDIAQWKRLLACLYGGINEEILMRLFFLALALWVFSKFRGGQLGLATFWTANFLVALVFGASHLPGAALTMPLTVSLILYVLVLNGIASLVFGYLFWQGGLEAAMLAHFSADLILQVIVPIVLP